MKPEQAMHCWLLVEVSQCKLCHRVARHGAQMRTPEGFRQATVSHSGCRSSSAPKLPNNCTCKWHYRRLPSFPFLAAEPDLLRRSRSAAGAFDACHVGYSSCSQGKLTEKQPRCRKTAFCALPHGGSCGQAGPSKRAFSVRQSCLEFDEISLSHTNNELQSGYSEYPFLIAFKYGSCPNNRIVSFDHPAGWGFALTTPCPC